MLAASFGITAGRFRSIGRFGCLSCEEAKKFERDRMAQPFGVIDDGLVGRKPNLGLSRVEHGYWFCSCCPAGDCICCCK